MHARVYETIGETSYPDVIIFYDVANGHLRIVAEESRRTMRDYFEGQWTKCEILNKENQATTTLYPRVR